MPSVQVSGVIPNTIREGTGLGAWVAGLTLTGDTARLTAIELTGAAALNFSAHWDAVLQLATLDVAAPIDFESFAAGRTQPQLVFGMRFVFDDGSRQTPTTTYRVAVIDQDDTPPDSLRFATTVPPVAGAIGSTIGTLAVTDPDSAGPFSFSFSAEDDWRFEVVGSTLKLRDGISLGLDEMPGHPLFINVSDGRQSAAFTLNLTVTDPGAQESAVAVVAAETPQHGFSLTEPQRVVALHEARDVTAANTYGEDIRQLMLAQGGEVWLPSVQKLQLADVLP
ncbi:MAG: cadherin repeat domain-containing protein, partial [Acetobacteraceae bacterium]